MTREDIECIIKWFSHIEQLATDGKTANGFQMPPDKILATIKVVAKDSLEYVEKFCYESTPNDLEEAAIKYFDNNCYPGEVGFECDSVGAFIGGANWQKEKLMKEAVEGRVAERVQGKLYARCQVPKTMGVEFGDKVRVIILKKED